MPKLKKKLTGNFTIINNTVLRDKRMGCTERGAYVTLVSMADDWNFSIRGLAAIMPDGVTKISGALKRLEMLGYIVIVLFLIRKDQKVLLHIELLYSQVSHKQNLS